MIELKIDGKKLKDYGFNEKAQDFIKYVFEQGIEQGKNDEITKVRDIIDCGESEVEIVCKLISLYGCKEM